MPASDYARVLVGFGVSGLAAAADPNNPTGFTDITQYVRRLKTDRLIGSGGKAAIYVNNQDARFDASNTSSPYNGNLVRNVPVVVQTKTAAGNAWQTEFAGYTQKGSWQTEYRDGLAIARINLGDGSSLLASTKRGKVAVAAGTGARVGARLADIADAYGWPAGWRSIDTGVATMDGDTWGNTFFAHMVDANEVEGGWLYFDKRGYLTFRDRHSVAGTWNVGLTVHETTENLAGSQVKGFRNTFRTAGFGDTTVNYVSMARPNGQAFIVDTRADATVPQTVLARNRLKAGSEADVAALAAWHGELDTQTVAFAETVGVRAAVPSTPGPTGTATILNRVCGVDLRDRVAVVYTPPGQTQQTYQVVVKRIRHELDMQRGGTWDTRFDFTPHGIYAALNSANWVRLGQANNLNGTQRLAY